VATCARKPTDNYSGLSLREEKKSGKFFPGVSPIQNVGCQDAVQNLVRFFCGGPGPFFSAAEKPEKSKIPERQRGDHRKMGPN
jgi:hypothetical protein